MRLAFLSALVLALGAYAARGQTASYQVIETRPSGTHASIEWSTAFLTKGAPPWQKVILQPIPDSQLASLIPAVQGHFGMVFIQCDQVAADGVLQSCRTTQAEPANAGYEKAAAALQFRLAAGPDAIAGMAPQLKYVALQVMLWNSQIDHLQGPCWAPRCITEPAPNPKPAR